MEDYPATSLDHNIPSVVLLGLSANSKSEPSSLLDGELKEQAVLLRSEIPLVEAAHARALLRHIQHGDASNSPWNGRDESLRYRFRIRTSGRTFLLPPRRARLPDDLDASEPPGALHSPFSPLSPSCRLYPDGIIDSSWLAKHQTQLPSVFICFYELTADATLATLRDNQIKSDINTLRNGLMQQGYRSRVAVVILCDSRPSSIEGVQERLDNIRKGCALDAKSFFFVPTPSSQEELERIADNMLVTVYAQATEYYRDLGRRARKKKGRGVVPQPTIPPTSGTSQTLSLAGWNVRYDFKSAVFAEFRQEMDQALRSYEQAYETLLGPDLLEMIPSWSPRWNEARQLSDIISIRAIRCMLWNGQTSTAVRRWQAHRNRLGDLIDSRGRGTANYGWRAWEARWAVVMAELVKKTDMPELSGDSGALFLLPEKTAMGERLQPWEMLHHPGYWYRTASRHLFARRILAYAIPEDDRRPPEDSRASKATPAAFTYDTYMCPAPHEEFPLPPSDGVGVDHAGLITKCLMAAHAEFQARGQLRFAAELALECAREYAALRRWKDVMSLLRPVWQDRIFTADSWLDVSEELAFLLRAAARQTGDRALLVLLDWELLNSKYMPRKNWKYDLSQALVGIATDKDSPSEDNGGKPSVEITDDLCLSLLETSFIFRTDEGKAGQTCQAQLAITSKAHAGSAPISLQNIRIAFQGSIKPVILIHDEAQASTQTRDGKVAFSAVGLREDSAQEQNSDLNAASSSASALVGSCDLTMLPGHTMIYEIGVPLREPGEAKALSARISASFDSFDMEYVAEFKDSSAAGTWHSSRGGRPRKIPRANSHSIRIQPRPPNMEIRLLSPMDQYYTNESIDLQFEILNAEDTDAIVKLDVLLTGDEPRGFKLLVAGEHFPAEVASADESRLLAVPLGTLPTSEAIKAVVQVDPMELPTSYDLTIRASYGLVSDPATPIAQTAVFMLPLTNPFEANYDLLPRLNPDPWPSLFDPEGVEALAAVAASVEAEDGGVGHVQPRGLAQTWCLVTRYASFASEDLRVVDLEVLVAPARGVRCRVGNRHALAEGEGPEEGLLVKPKTIEEAQFDITAHRLSLDEREPVGLDVSFSISWSRPGAEAVNTTRLPVPRLMIFGVEPRVLASVSYSNPPRIEAGSDSTAASVDGDASAGLVILDIVIENASNHFLTFGLTMEPSNDFAFSGSKMTTMHLVPVSRRSVTYRLLPLVRGAWIKPHLTVRDKYFQKVLRIIPTEGMKLDKDGFLVWVPPLADE